MSEYHIQGETGASEVVIGLEVHAQVTSNASMNLDGNTKIR